MSDESSVAIAYDCFFPLTTGGGERLYRAVAETMSGRGRRVDYLTATQWPGRAPETPGFRLVSVTGKLDLYDSDGVRRTSAALIFAWGLFRALLRRRRRYDAIVVSGLPVLNVFAARAALLGSGTSIVVDYLEVWHRRQWVEYSGRIIGNIAWVMQRLAIAITPIASCHSQLTARRLRREGFRRTLLVSPGLIEQADGTPGVAAAAAEPPFILYAGRHIPDKRVDRLPSAVAAAREAIPGLRLVVLGDGPTTEAVRREVKRVDGSSWTELPGFVSQDRLDNLMSGAACLVNPSRREGYGLVVVEAAAHGTPVVLVDDEDNASTELVTPGTNGFIAASAESDQLASAIVDAVTGGIELRMRSREWYDDAVRTRTIARTVDQMLAALDASSKSRRGRKPAPKAKGERP